MYERLAELRDIARMSQQEVADVLGVQRNTYGNYESGVREMSYKAQVKIADFYNVSLDYLHGRTDKPTVNKDKHIDHEAEFMVKSMQLYREIRAKEKRG